MATSLRRLRLPINYKIAGIKSSCGRSTVNWNDENSKRASSYCKVIQTGVGREVESGTSLLLKYQPADCVLRTRCMCSGNTSLAEQQKSWSPDNNYNSNDNGCCGCVNYEEERQKSLLPVIWSQPFNQNSWPLPVQHLPYTYDSLSLPIKTYQGMDDMHIEDSNSLIPVEISTHNTQFPVFSGYLESYPYYMYCNGANNHPLLTLSDFEHNFVSTAYVANKKTHDESQGKPSEEVLKGVYLKLADNLPKFFVEPIDYSVYHRDIVFQNNIRGVTTTWTDGFSVFFVGSDGLVYKHVCDKMMPDEEKISSKGSSVGSSVAIKFALVLGLLPRPYGADMMNSNSFVQQELPCNQS